MWDSIGAQDRPILLGYAVGFRICQAAYYAAAEDKTAALQTLLAMPDPRAVLTASGYLGK